MALKSGLGKGFALRALRPPRVSHALFTPNWPLSGLSMLAAFRENREREVFASRRRARANPGASEVLVRAAESSVTAQTRLTAPSRASLCGESS